MDAKWFKEQQKRAGVTAEEIARELGRDRSVVSRIYTERQPMSHQQARGFAKILGVSLADVLAHAGVLEDDEAQQIAPGYSESDVVKFVAKPSEVSNIAAILSALVGDRRDLDVWRVKGLALALAGYLPGDFLIVDADRSELVRAGDIVIAQKFERNGTAATLLRRYEPPVLVAASADPGEQRVHVVDGSNVVIRGLVVASWRAE